MRKHKSKKKSQPIGPDRILVEVSPHRTTGGAHIEGLTPYPAEHESYNEKFAIPILVLCHDVNTFQSQKEIRYLDAMGIERTYTADFSVQREGQLTELLLEAKSLEFLVRADSIAKYQEIASYLRKTKQPFSFIVDSQLLQQPLRTTANLLFRYVTSTPSAALIQRAETTLAEGSMPISRLCTLGKLELVDVYTLIAKRHLCIDWQVPLDTGSLVSLPNRPFKGLTLERFLRSTRHGDFLAALAMARGTPDKRLLADASAWRQDRLPLTPWNFVAGFSGKAPLRDLREGELRAEKSWHRRHHAAGKTNQSIDA